MPLANKCVGGVAITDWSIVVKMMNTLNSNYFTAERHAGVNTLHVTAVTAHSGGAALGGRTARRRGGLPAHAQVRLLALQTTLKKSLDSHSRLMIIIVVLQLRTAQLARR